MKNANLPTISVLIPAFNAEKTIRRAIKSVLRQSYPNMEIIVVNDGSRDKTGEILQKMTQKVHKKGSKMHTFTVLEKPNEGNLARTRNFLLDHCHTEHFCFVDADDVCKRHYVRAMYRDMVRTNADLTACTCRFNPIVKLPIFKFFTFRHHVYTGMDKFRALVLTGTLNPSSWCKLYRRSVAPDLRFDEVARFSEDVIWNWYYLERCERVSWFELPLYHYIQKPSGEVHAKLGEAKLAHVARVTEIMEAEPNVEKKNILRAWIALCSCHFRQIGKRDPNTAPETIAMLEQNMAKYEQYHQAPGTWWVFRLTYWFLKRKGNKRP